MRAESGTPESATSDATTPERRTVVSSGTHRREIHGMRELFSTIAKSDAMTLTTGEPPKKKKVRR